MDPGDVAIVRALPTAAVLAVLAFVTGAEAAGTAEFPPSPLRQRELLHLLRQDCGSCHGLTLKGGLGPALTAEALRSRPAESLVATIVSGRAGTAMPPWNRFMSEIEAQWLVERMRAGAVDVSR